MKVTESEYKIVPVKYAAICYIGFVILAIFILYTTQLDNRVLIAIKYCNWGVVFVFSVFSLSNGRKAIALQQYPAPNTRVLSGWNVYKGKKAVSYGRRLVIASTVIIALTIFRVSYWLYLF